MRPTTSLDSPVSIFNLSVFQNTWKELKRFVLRSCRAAKAMYITCK